MSYSSNESISITSEVLIKQNINDPLFDPQAPEDVEYLFSDFDIDSDSDDIKPPQAKKTKKNYDQNFREAWLSDPLFKDWLQSVAEDKYKAYCVACNLTLKCGKSELKKHSITMKHANNMSNFEIMPSAVVKYDDSYSEEEKEDGNISPDKPDIKSSYSIGNVMFSLNNNDNPVKTEKIEKRDKLQSNFSNRRRRRQKITTMIPQHEGNLNGLQTLKIEQPKEYVFHVELNRPEKLNALNKNMWLDIKKCFEFLNTNPDCRVIVLSAAGKLFSAGIDLQDMMKLGQELADIDEVSRRGLAMGKLIKLYQDSITSLEQCTKPVIVAVHGPCVGAGVDLITAADIRYCSSDAWFQVKEVEIGMAADVGTLQRLPKVVHSQSLARELCFTGRKFLAPEAHQCGLVSKIFENKEELLKAAIDLAFNIAEKSPVAVQATKKNMVYSLDHTNQEGLDHIREMNMLLLQSEDFLKKEIDNENNKKNKITRKLLRISKMKIIIT